MGNCAVHQYTEKAGDLQNMASSTAKVIHMDGRLLEFEQPVKASLVLTLHPNSFLCSSESMYVGCHMPQMPDDEELQLGQVYFLMPRSNSHSPLSLHDLCELAIKASAALADESDTQQHHAQKGMPSSLCKSGSTLPSGDHQQLCRVSIADLGLLFRIFQQANAIRPDEE